MMGPLWPISIHRSPVALLKFQMAPKLILLMSSGSKKKEPRYACLSEAKASHSQRMWAEVSSSAPHLLHSGLSDSPIRWRCLLRVLCPVRRPVTALDCILLKDRNLTLTPKQGPKMTRTLSERVNSLAIYHCPRTQFDSPPGLVAGSLHFLFVLYVTVLTATYFRATLCGQFMFFVSSAKLPFECRDHPRVVTFVCWSIQCHWEKSPPNTLQNARYKSWTSFRHMHVLT